MSIQEKEIPGWPELPEEPDAEITGNKAEWDALRKFDRFLFRARTGAEFSETTAVPDRFASYIGSLPARSPKTAQGWARVLFEKRLPGFLQNPGAFPKEHARMWKEVIGGSKGWLHNSGLHTAFPAYFAAPKKNEEKEEETSKLEEAWFTGLKKAAVEGQSRAAKKLAGFYAKCVEERNPGWASLLDLKEEPIETNQLDCPKIREVFATLTKRGTFGSIVLPEALPQIGEFLTPHLQNYVRTALEDAKIPVESVIPGPRKPNASIAAKLQEYRKAAKADKENPRWVNVEKSEALCNSLVMDLEPDESDSEDTVVLDEVETPAPKAEANSELSLDAKPAAKKPSKEDNSELTIDEKEDKDGNFWDDGAIFEIDPDQNKDNRVHLKMAEALLDYGRCCCTFAKPDDLVKAVAALRKGSAQVVAVENSFVGKAPASEHRAVNVYLRFRLPGDCEVAFADIDKAIFPAGVTFCVEVQLILAEWLKCKKETAFSNTIGRAKDFKDYSLLYDDYIIDYMTGKRRA